MPRKLMLSGKEDGWVRLYRSIRRHNDWPKRRAFTPLEAWIDLILLVNHEDRKIRHQGEIILVPRGSALAAVSWLAKRWRWSRGKVVRYLAGASCEGEISQITNNRRTIVNLLNYNKLNDPEDTRTNNRRTTDGQPTGTRRTHRRKKELQRREEGKSPLEVLPATQPPTLYPGAARDPGRGGGDSASPSGNGADPHPTPPSSEDLDLRVSRLLGACARHCGKGRWHYEPVKDPLARDALRQVLATNPDIEDGDVYTTWIHYEDTRRSRKALSFSWFARDFSAHFERAAAAVRNGTLQATELPERIDP